MPSPDPSPPGRRARRILTFAAPPAALLLLAWLGRYAISSASPAAPQASPNAPTAQAAEAGSGGAERGGPPDSAAAAPGATGPPDAPDAARSAVEVLADGGIVVDLNLANEDDLRHLPGVGAVRARAIVDLRKRLGRFKSVDDLARIKGFGRSFVRKLRPFTRASAP